LLEDVFPFINEFQNFLEVIFLYKINYIYTFIYYIAGGFSLVILINNKLKKSFPENKKTDISLDTWMMLLEFHYVTKGNKANYDPSGILYH
jgi:hypothetical protein